MVDILLGSCHRSTDDHALLRGYCDGIWPDCWLCNIMSLATLLQQMNAPKPARSRRHSPEAREKLSATMRDKLADPEYRAAHIKRAQDSGHKVAAAMREKYADPAYREAHKLRVREAVKASQKRRRAAIRKAAA